MFNYGKYYRFDGKFAFFNQIILFPQFYMKAQWWAIVSILTSCTYYTRGELDQLGYIRRVGYRLAPLYFCFVFAPSFYSFYD